MEVSSFLGRASNDLGVTTFFRHIHLSTSLSFAGWLLLR